MNEHKRFNNMIKSYDLILFQFLLLQLVESKTSELLLDSLNGMTNLPTILAVKMSTSPNNYNGL